MASKVPLSITRWNCLSNLVSRTSSTYKRREPKSKTSEHYKVLDITWLNIKRSFTIMVWKLEAKSTLFTKVKNLDNWESSRPTFYIKVGTTITSRNWTAIPLKELLPPPPRPQQQEKERGKDRRTTRKKKHSQSEKGKIVQWKHEVHTYSISTQTRQRACTIYIQVITEKHK